MGIRRTHSRLKPPGPQGGGGGGSVRTVVKTHSRPVRRCPAAGIKLEIGQLSSYCMAKISLNVTLKNNKTKQNQSDFFSVAKRNCTNQRLCTFDMFTLINTPGIKWMYVSLILHISSFQKKKTSANQSRFCSFIILRLINTKKLKEYPRSKVNAKDCFYVFNISYHCMDITSYHAINIISRSFIIFMRGGFWL